MSQLSKEQQVWLTAWAAAVQNDAENAWENLESNSTASKIANEAVKQFKAAFPEEEVPEPPKVEWVEKTGSSRSQYLWGDWELLVHDWYDGTKVIMYRIWFERNLVWNGPVFQDIQSAKSACEQKFRELWAKHHSNP